MEDCEEYVGIFRETCHRGEISYGNKSLNSDMRAYPKVSGLAAWSEDCKWYSSLPLDAVVSLFCESV
jgi:hypothetical protein